MNCQSLVAAQGIAFGGQLVGGFVCIGGVVGIRQRGRESILVREGRGLLTARNLPLNMNDNPFCGEGNVCEARKALWDLIIHVFWVSISSLVRCHVTIRSYLPSPRGLGGHVKSSTNALSLHQSIYL